ncbi:hypothetical protein AV654_19655 [Paenibacillus elgii]|uniref:Uncharacterized protein n=1 Tax=Paenibacillus elgii TaxID=189691 RepID=A0A163XNS9_9BACL|nr:hypothetical protein [Paenibacillus elgii]KZE78193.1 hypothetical protein AV654_19655 [Paenibacillus elgii]
MVKLILKSWGIKGIRRNQVDKSTKKQYNKKTNSRRNIDVANNEELMTMAVSEKRLESKMQESLGRQRPPISQAIKKIGVRSAFGVSPVDLLRNDRRGK